MKFLLSLITALGVFFSTLPVNAFTPSVHLPVTLNRLTSASQLTDGCLICLASTDHQGNLLLLTSQLLNNKKMQGYQNHTQPTSQLQITQMAHLWRVFKDEEGGICLEAADGKGWLTRRKAGALGMCMKETPTDLARWELSEGSNQLFRLSEAGLRKREIMDGSSYINGKHYYYFDNYTLYDVCNLYIYKVPEKFSDQTGNCILPDAGTRIVLTGGNFVRLTSGSALQADDLVLCNGTLAPAENLDSWLVERPTDRTFILTNAQGQHLNYNLQAGTAINDWQIKNGLLCTTEAEPRYLCFEILQKQWVLLPDKAAETAHVLATGMVTLAPQPQKHLDKAGCCSLSGGWSATALAQLPLEGAGCLDLTALNLPIKARSFEAKEAQGNFPIFVAEQMVEYVPASWHMAIACGSTNRLIASTELTDRMPFYTDRPFEVKAGQLRYTRQASGKDGWQTLCLPFNAKLPAQFKASTLLKAEADSLHFAPVAELEAGKSYLIYMENEPLTLECQKGIVVPAPINLTQFQGCYHNYQVADTERNVYLLVPGANQFKQAAATSKLAPFRARLQLSDAHPSVLRF